MDKQINVLCSCSSPKGIDYSKYNHIISELFEDGGGY